MSADRLAVRRDLAVVLATLGGRHRVLASIDLQAGAVRRATVHVVAARQLDALAEEYRGG